MNKFLLLTLLILVLACSDEQKFFCDPTNQPKNLTLPTLVYDTVVLDSVVSSYSTLSLIKDNKVLMVDAMFLYLYEFDVEGKLLGRYLGQGKSLKELPMAGLEACVEIDNEDLLFYDSSGSWYVCDTTYTRKHLNLNRLYHNGFINPQQYDDTEIYSYMSDKMTMKYYDHFVYVPIVADNDQFNLFTPDFAENCRIITKINVAKVKEEKTLGRLSPEYAKSTGNVFPYSNFDIDKTNGDFYVTYELDSLIYVYDKEFNIKHSFGYKGIDMKTDYQYIVPENFRKLYLFEREKRGYYDRVWLVNGKIFRTYKKGDHTPFEGLQIYDNGVLIADVETPKDFTVIGYIAPYYITSISSDEVNNKQWFYKFKL